MRTGFAHGITRGLECDLLRLLNLFLLLLVNLTVLCLRFSLNCSDRMLARGIPGPLQRLRLVLALLISILCLLLMRPLFNLLLLQLVCCRSTQLGLGRGCRQLAQLTLRPRTPMPTGRAHLAAPPDDAMLAQPTPATLLAKILYLAVHTNISSAAGKTVAPFLAVFAQSRPPTGLAPLLGLAVLTDAGSSTIPAKILPLAVLANTIPTTVFANILSLAVLADFGTSTLFAAKFVEAVLAYTGSPALFAQVLTPAVLANPRPSTEPTLRFVHAVLADASSSAILAKILPLAMFTNSHSSAFPAVALLLAVLASSLCFEASAVCATPLLVAVLAQGGGLAGFAAALHIPMLAQFEASAVLAAPLFVAVLAHGGGLAGFAAALHISMLAQFHLPSLTPRTKALSPAMLTNAISSFSSAVLAVILNLAMLTYLRATAVLATAFQFAVLADTGSSTVFA